MTYKTPVVVEIWYSAAWHDITSDVLTSSPITITQGRSDEAQQLSPGTLTLTLNNPSAKYSPRNPMSALYGLIGRNTQIRVSVTGYGTRFVGEIESWPQQWDLADNGWVPITAYGIVRRLGGLGTQAQTDSALHRYLMSGAQSGLISYWPMQDGDLTPHVGTTQLSVTYTDAAGTTGTGAELATWLGNGVSLDGTVVLDVAYPAKPTTSFSILDALVLVRNGLPNESGGAFQFGIYDVGIVDGVAYDYWVNAVWSAGVPSLELVRHQVTGTSTVMHTYNSSDAATLWDGNVHMLGIRLDAGVGTNVNVSITVDGVNPGISYSHGTTNTLWDNPRCKMAAAGLRGASLGHLQLWARSSTISASDINDAASGYASETADERIDRICTEENISGTTLVVDSTAAMGPQAIGSVLGWLQESADADGGILREARSELGLVYVSLDSLYDQDAVAVLSYTGGEVSPPLQPVEDTQHTANDVTVTRANGGTSNVTRDTGPLNISEPVDDPQGVGRYPAQYTLNLDSDDQTLQQAGWKLHLGTWDEPRYPSITVDLTALHEAGKTSLMADVADIGISDRIQITNPPAWQGPDTVDQLVQGYTEVIGAFSWTITFNTSPARPYDVGILGTDRLDTLDSTADAMNSTAASFQVSTPFVGTFSNFGFSATAVPYDIAIDGERMTVTAVSHVSAVGGNHVQSLTVTRSVNGVVKTHASGAKVQLYHAFRLAR